MNEQGTLADYIAAVAEDTPAPGAGSVSAIIGALGCALGEMVCGITMTNASYEPNERLEKAHSHLGENRRQLTVLAGQDEAAYGQFREALALPKSTDTEKTIRREAMARTLYRAAVVPLQIAETGAQSLVLLAIVAESGSKHAFADVCTAAYALDASARGALENVWVNLAVMKDEESRSGLTERADLVESLRDQSLANVRTAILRRQDEGKTR